jgi:hypothetical protein
MLCDEGHTGWGEKTGPSVAGVQERKPNSKPASRSTGDKDASKLAHKIIGNASYLSAKGQINYSY